MPVFKLFAAESGPTIHIAPTGLMQLGPIEITNSVLYGWIAIIFITVLLITVARKVTVRPSGSKLVGLIELGVDFITNLVTGAFNDKEKGRKYVPFFVTLFFFILLNNWLGLLPIIGEAFTSGGQPLFRPFTADLNGTLAAGVFTMITVYIASVREAGGPGKFLRHFFAGNPLNPLYLIIGILEMFTDLTRVFSLSLRLFLNVTIGEIVIAVFAYLGQFAAPLTALPFTLIELFVGALQAYIFTLLGLMYLAISVNASQHETEDRPAKERLTRVSTAETMGVEPGAA